MGSKDDELSVRQRMLSASWGGLMTSVLVTPFDVVRIRQQATFAPLNRVALPRSEGSCRMTSSHYRVQQGVMDVWCPKCEFAGCTQVSGGFFSTVLQVVRQDGVLALWRGLRPTLVMSIPANVIYFTAYDELVLRVKPLLGGFSPLLAGTSARLLATAAVSPLELLRTKQQHSGRALGEMLRGELKAGGVKHLFRGLVPTLWRDVPFSAVYWTGYEQMRARTKNSTWLLAFPPQDRVFVEAFCCGASSAFVASTLTHPFDLVKTRLQIEAYALDETRTQGPPSSTRDILRTIVKEEGYRGLFIGWGPRVSKIVPACAIMISTYEFAKHYFKGRRTT